MAATIASAGSPRPDHRSGTLPVPRTRREISAHAAALGWTRPQTARNLTYIGVVAVSFALLGWLASESGTVVRLGAWIAMAFLLLGAAAMTHEAAHSQLFSARAANQVAGTLTGLILFFPWAAYTAYHLQHHVHTGRDGDPEGEPAALTAKWQLFAIPVGMVWFLVELWGGVLGAATRVRSPSWLRTQAQRRSMCAALAIHAITYAALFLFVPLSVLAVTWLAPLAIALLFIVPFVLGAEHLGAPSTTSDDGPVDQLAVTRWIRSNAVMRALYRNHNCHNAHHYLPAITSRHLPHVEALIADQVPSNMYARSYTGFYVELWRSL